MSDIQRWNIMGGPTPGNWQVMQHSEGKYVRYVDHIAVVLVDSAARLEVEWQAGYEKALADAVAAVEALPFDFPLDDVHRGRIHKAAAIAAIKGVGK